MTITRPLKVIAGPPITELHSIFLPNNSGVSRQIEYAVLKGLFHQKLFCLDMDCKINLSNKKRISWTLFEGPDGDYLVITANVT